MNRPHSTDHDDHSSWKDLIEGYFLVSLVFFPTAFDQIDWSRIYQLPDRDLRKIFRMAKIGRRLANKLIEFYLNSGKPNFDIHFDIHIEFQEQCDSKFQERMFLYPY